MYSWALSLSTGDGVNKRSGLRHRGAGLSPRSTLTDRLKARLKCVGCGDLYWKSFTLLFPQGLCPSTTEAPQTKSQSLFWLFGHIRQQRILKKKCTKEPQCPPYRGQTGICFPEVLTKEGYLCIYLFSKIAAIIDSKEHQGAGSRIVHTGSQQNGTCLVFLVCNLILPEGMWGFFSPLSGI